MNNNYPQIQELLHQKADYQARLNLLPYDGTPEVKEDGGKKYLYVRKRIGSRLSSTYVDVYSDTLYQLLLRNARDAKEYRKNIRRLDKELAQLGYTDQEISPRVQLNLDFARANMKSNIYDQAILEGVATSFPQTEDIIDNGTMRAGDVILALPSSGVHSNGFSLVRRVFDVEKADLRMPVAELGGASIGETLLTPTKIYVNPVLALLEKIPVKGISHITGGGFYENIPRSIPQGLGARIEKKAVRVLPIFDMIAKAGGIPERDMYNTFNMGVGMCVVVSGTDADAALSILRGAGEDAYVLGEITASDERVTLC